MAQQLEYHDSGPDGKKIKRTIRVLRTWLFSDGRTLYLHASGVYGYKNEAPVKAKVDLAMISDPIQRRQAEAWWDTRGHKISAAYYAAEEQRLEQLALAGLPITGDATELDQVMYIRRLVKDRRRAAFGDPFSWPQYFERRPDWWGQASAIDLGEWRYERLDPQDVPAEPEDSKPVKGPQQDEASAIDEAISSTAPVVGEEAVGGF